MAGKSTTKRSKRKPIIKRRIRCRAGDGAGSAAKRAGAAAGLLDSYRAELDDAAFFAGLAAATAGVKASKKKATKPSKRKTVRI